MSADQLQPDDMPWLIELLADDALAAPLSLESPSPRGGYLEHYGSESPVELPPSFDDVPPDADDDDDDTAWDEKVTDGWLERYGSEPPGPGWTFAGNATWRKRTPATAADDEIDDFGDEDEDREHITEDEKPAAG